MPLVKCPDCLKDVSDRSNVCTHCGAPLVAKLLIVEDENKWNFTINRGASSVDNLIGKILQEMVATSSATRSKSSQFPKGQVPFYVHENGRHFLCLPEKTFWKQWVNQFEVKAEEINPHETVVKCFRRGATSMEFWNPLVEQFREKIKTEAK